LIINDLFSEVIDVKKQDVEKDTDKESLMQFSYIFTNAHKEFIQEN